MNGLCTRSGQVTLWFLLAAIAALIGVSAHAGANRWTTNGPYGGAVRCIVIDPQDTDTLYAGTGSGAQYASPNYGGGVYKSKDGGATWSPINKGIPFYSVSTIVLDPSKRKTLYAVCQDAIRVAGSHVVKSTDGGNEWTTLDPRVFDRLLVMDPQVPATLYVADMGVRKSTDGGKSWTEMAAGLPVCGNISLAIDPKTPSTLYVTTWGYGLYKTTNAAATWAPANAGLPEPWIWSFCVDPVTPSTLYAGLSDEHGVGTVYKTNDAGSSWFEASAGLPPIPVACFAVDPTNRETVYAGLYDTYRGPAAGLYKTTDGGATWQAVNTGLSDLRVSTVAVNPANPSVLYVGTYAGVHKSTDGGMTWTILTSGMTNIWVETLAFDATDPLTVYAGSASGLFRTRDGCATWDSLRSSLPGLGINYVAADPHTTQTVFAVTYDPTKNEFRGLYKSTDGGDTWALKDTGIQSGGGFPWLAKRRIAFNLQNPQVLYLAGYYIRKSEDGGETWRHVGTVSSTDCNDLVVDPSSPDTLYASTMHGVQKSVDGGVTWVPKNAGLTDSMQVYCMAMDPQTPTTLYIGTWLSGTGPGFVFKSTNGAETWQQVAWSTGDIYSMAVDPADTSLVYLSLLFGGVYKGSEGGTSWYQMRRGLTNLFVNPVAVNPLTPRTYYAATSNGECNGVWTFSQVDVTPPTISRVTAQSSPFRLTVEGGNFHGSAEVMINGWAAPKTAWKSTSVVLAKGGKTLDAWIPRGSTVMITVENANDGGVSAPYFFTRK